MITIFDIVGIMIAFVTASILLIALFRENIYLTRKNARLAEQLASLKR